LIEGVDAPCGIQYYFVSFKRGEQHIAFGLFQSISNNQGTFFAFSEEF